MKTTDEHIKGIEIAILRVYELIQQASKLEKRYQEIRKRLEAYQDELLRLKREIDGLKEKFHELAAPSIAQEFNTAGDQVKKSDEEISKVEKDMKKDMKELEEIIQSISKCKAELNEASTALTKCNDKTERHTSALEHEHNIKLHRAADKMGTAKKWGIGGVVAMVGGAGTAVLGFFTGKRY